MTHILQSTTMATKVVLFILALFCIIQLIFVWDGGVNKVFNSPDANANYHFASRVAAGKIVGFPLQYQPNEYNAYLSTRSSRVINNTIVPAGFLGLPVIYGLLSRLFFFPFIPLLIIFIAAIGLFYFYKLLRLLFNEYIGLISVALTVLHPAVWYYTYDSLLPNMLFVSVLMILLYAFIKALHDKRMLTYIAVIILLDILFLIRASEFIWIIPLLLLIAYFNRKNIQSYKYCVFSFGLVVLSLSLAWFAQSAFYLNTITLGYDLGVHQADSVYEFIKRAILPFGFDALAIVRNFKGYGLSIFWPFTLVITAAIAYITMSEQRLRGWRTYLIFWAVFSAYSIIYYGSGSFLDHPDPEAVTISVAYVRYFLPMYIFSLPLVARALELLAQHWSWLKFSLPLTLLIIFSLFTGRLVFFDTDDGILARRTILRGYDMTASNILFTTEANAIIVSGSADKYIWPHRNVLPYISSDEARSAVSYFLKELEVPMYYVSLTLSDESQGLLNEDWYPFGFEMQASIMTSNDISLYPIIRI